MRKIYSLLLALFMIPLMSVAANQAISKAARTSGTDKSDSRAYVQPDVIRAADGGTAPSYTIAAWVKLGQYSAVSSSCSNNMVIMGYGGREHCNDNGSWNLIVNNGALSINGWGGFETTLNATVTTGEWHYLVVAYNKRTVQMEVYLDGTLAGSKYYSGNGTGHEWFTNENPAIYFGGYCFNGQIDEVQIWNKALTADEVTAAMTSAPAVDGLVGFYTFDQGTTETGVFANESTQAVASTEPCYFENVTGSQAWANGPVYVISEGTYALTDPTIVESDRVTTVDEYTVTIASSDVTMGTVAFVSPAAEGETLTTSNPTVTVKATPAEGCRFVNWTDGSNQVVSTEAEFTYAATTTVTLTANFIRPESYTITLAASPAEGGTVEFVSPAAEGTSLTTIESAVVVRATPAEGYKFLYWMNNVDAMNFSRTQECTITNETTATWTAFFEQMKTYTVTIEQPAQGGTITVTANGETLASGATVTEGTVLTLDKTAASGFQFVGFVVNGVSTVESTVTVNENVTISAEFEEGLEYCTLTGVTSRTDSRGITSLSVSDNNGNSATVTGPGTGRAQALYVDQTGTILTTKAGATITVKNNGAGSWMHSYVYIDINNNGVFDVNEANCRGANVDGELFSHTGYTGVNGADPTVMSNGRSIDYGTSYSLTMPSFTLPADLAPGDYRVRHKIDWNCVDPCGRTSANGYSGNFISDNGGGIIDFTIRIESENYDTPRTITVAAANDAHGTVAITNPATEGNEVSTEQKAVTIEATPAEGYAFLNWTDGDGNVVATTATYTYTGAEDASFTANFGFTLNYTVGENGSASFMVGTSSVATGSVLAPGTEVTVVATPDTGKFAQVSVNGAALELTENAGSFTMEEATTVAVSFVDAIYTLTINKIGDGEVIVSDNGTPKTGPTGNEYTTGSVITNISLRVFAKPAEGGQLVSVSYEDEGGSSKNVTMNAVTAEGWEGWYYGGAAKATGNRVLTIEFTTSQGIDEIGIDPANGPVEYYNLQGVRVGTENLVPGFYIIRQGEKAAKVFINK